MKLMLRSLPKKLISYVCCFISDAIIIYFQCLSQEIRKAMSLMKEVAVDLERDNQSQMVFLMICYVCLFVYVLARAFCCQRMWKIERNKVH